MSDRAYDQGVADGIRSGNPGLHELSKQIADLRSRLGVAEGRIEQAHLALQKGKLKALVWPRTGNTCAEDLLETVKAGLVILEPANAEGIASEGHDAEPDPREEESLEGHPRYPRWKVDLFRDSVKERQDQRFLGRASAGAACDHAQHLPKIARSQEGDTATCRCGLTCVAVHEESEGAWWEPVDAPSAEADQPTTVGGDATCREQSTRKPACNPAPSPTGGGAEERIAKTLFERDERCWHESDVKQGADKVFPARTWDQADERDRAEYIEEAQAVLDALTQPVQPDWQALAEKLADLLGRAQPYIQVSEGSYAQWLEASARQALARYHAAIAQGGGAPPDSSETREAILRLARRALTSADIQTRLGLSQAVVDGHLRALRKGGT